MVNSAAVDVVGRRQLFEVVILFLSDKYPVSSGIAGSCGISVLVF